VNYRERRGVGDRQRWVAAGRSEAACGETGLQLPGFAQGRLHLALEALLDDELGLSVAE
jgi:hypothetical protein